MSAKQPSKSGQGSSRADKPVPVDERNLTSGGSPAGLEDRLHIWWVENRMFLLVSSIAVLAVAALFQGTRIYQDSREESIRKWFSTVETKEERLEFARSHSRHPLGGVTFLELADQSFQDEEYSLALEYYRQAVEGLQGNPLLGRARLGVAASLLNLGDREDAAALLDRIARDRVLFHAIRGEAAHLRAIIALEDQDADAFDQAEAILLELPFAEGWLSRLEMLRPDASALPRS